MICRTYSVNEIDQPFLDGLLMLSKHGVEVVVHTETAVPLPAVSGIYQDYYLLDRDRTVSITLHNAAQIAVFDDWVKKEQFRFSLKGKQFLILIAVDEAIPWS